MKAVLLILTLWIFASCGSVKQEQESVFDYGVSTAKLFVNADLSADRIAVYKQAYEVMNAVVEVEDTDDRMMDVVRGIMTYQIHNGDIDPTKVDVNGVFFLIEAMVRRLDKYGLQLLPWKEQVELMKEFRDGIDSVVLTGLKE